MTGAACKPTRAVKRLLDRMTAEIWLYRIKEDDRNRWVFVFASGETARSDVVRRAIDGGFIVPYNDALFESEQSQTWRKA